MIVIEQNVRKRILEIVDIENNLISNNSSDVMRNRFLSIILRCKKHMPK